MNLEPPGLYRCFLDVSTELAMLELHLEDQGQTVLAEAEDPVPLNQGCFKNSFCC